MSTLPKKIIFVYNADTDLFSQVTDAARKVIAPSTYSCNLCMLTYGSLAMKKKWKNFLQSLPQEKIFLHRDEFAQEYSGSNLELPAILEEQDGNISTLISAQELNSVQALDQLIELMRERVS